jgi:hypothetical protein
VGYPLHFRGEEKATFLARFTPLVWLCAFFTFNASQNVFGQDWHVNLQDQTSVLQVIAAKDLRWNPLAGQESEYRSQSELLDLAAAYDRKLPLSKDQLSMSFETWDVQYKPMKVFQVYNEARIQKLRDQLTAVVDEALPELAVLQLPSEEQLFAILKKDKELFQRLTLLWPFRNYGMLQRDRTLFQIQNLSPEKLDELFRDQNKMHFIAKLEDLAKGDQTAEKALAWVKRVYFQEMIEPAFQMSTMWRSLAAPAHLRVESAPALIALTRGQCGRDCSRRSVPLYALSKDARVFFVWNTNTELPDAYVFVAKVSFEGRQIPYIVTINGQSLDFSQVRSLVALVSQIYQSDEVVVPNFRINNSVVNNNLISTALKFSKGTRVDVEMPSDWQTISEFARIHEPRQRQLEYPDVYARETLKDAYLVDLRKISENEGLQLFTVAGRTQSYEEIPLDEVGKKEFAKFRWLKAIEETVKRKALPMPVVSKKPKPQTLIFRDVPVPQHPELGMLELNSLSFAGHQPALEERTTDEILERPDLVAFYKNQASWLAHLLSQPPGRVEDPADMEQFDSQRERRSFIFTKIARYFTKPALRSPMTSQYPIGQLDRVQRDKLIAIWNEGNPLNETLESWAIKRGCETALDTPPATYPSADLTNFQ